MNTGGGGQKKGAKDEAWSIVLGDEVCAVPGDGEFVDGEAAAADDGAILDEGVARASFGQGVEGGGVVVGGEDVVTAVFPIL